MTEFNHLHYLDLFISTYNNGEFYNNSVAKVERSGDYRILGIHKLTPGENSGKHNLYIDVIDDKGERLNELIKWGWIGQKPNEHAQPLSLDKPMNEPAGGMPIWGGQIIWATILGKDADTISNVTTGLPDEPPGNTWGHFSYYVAWMKTDGTLPPPPPPEGDCTDLLAEYLKLKEEHIALVSGLKGLLGL